MAEQSGFTLAVCAEMVFRDLPMIERVRRIHALGWPADVSQEPVRSTILR